MTAWSLLKASFSTELLGGSLASEYLCLPRWCAMQQRQRRQPQQRNTTTKASRPRPYAMLKHWRSRLRFVWRRGVASRARSLSLSLRFCPDSLLAPVRRADTYLYANYANNLCVLSCGGVSVVPRVPGVLTRAAAVAHPQVRTDSRTNIGWYYEGGGLNRPVHLVTVPAVRIEEEGVFVVATPHGPLQGRTTAATALVRVSTEVTAMALQSGAMGDSKQHLRTAARCDRCNVKRGSWLRHLCTVCGRQQCARRQSFGGTAHPAGERPVVVSRNATFVHSSNAAVAVSVCTSTSIGTPSWHAIGCTTAVCACGG